MRIIAGEFRGLRLAALGKGDPGAHLRPTPDRVRESLFSMLTSRLGDFEDLHVLDLFAGTGALGLEALSRGAATATFVEKGRKSQSLIRQNIALTRSEARCALLGADATRLPPCSGTPADLVFLDPPYGKGLGEQALASARASGWIAPEAMILWEDNSPHDAPEGFTVETQRRFGDTQVTLLTLG
ncbi:16S rRNA (guanine(966)-N(2))-methyltransferase RsmD [Fluviibacterium sp. DFM31]|uniref:16S rRNA (Guanine(966)-N(2))-methyltransferase RsmD n=1 Tax=Meridianimarinicoccus marinus TaxID=3231483 RepID=A0ABV3L8I3_9RHOB